MAFWSPFPIDGYFAHSRYMVEGLGPASVMEQTFYSAWEVLPKEWMGMERGEDGEDKRMGWEKKLGLICKIRLF